VGIFYVGCNSFTDQIASDVNEHIGGDRDSSSIIAGTVFAKKGKKSVGVVRQWRARLGKMENCQIGLFAMIYCRDKVILIDTIFFYLNFLSFAPKKPL